jgi:hypothetical protein
MSGDITFVVLNFRDKKKGKKEFSVQILPCLAFCPADAVVASHATLAGGHGGTPHHVLVFFNK